MRGAFYLHFPAQEEVLRTIKLSKIFKSAGIPYKQVPDMHLWQLCHLAMVVPIADAYYEADIRKLIVEQLAGEETQLYAAANGREAYQLFLEHQPDLALLDIMMPELDGMSLLAKIRETSDMPVIFISARGEEYDRVLALIQGADDFLVKPFGRQELLARIGVR